MQGGAPTGNITLFFCDIEGSTRLLHRLGDDYASVLAQHRQLLRAAAAAHGGYEVDAQGDAFFAAFARAVDAVAAAVDAQRALFAHGWPEGANVRVRMGLHTGEPMHTEGDYVGLDVHRGARIMAAGHGGQILLSKTTRDRVSDSLPPGVSLRPLGEHWLKDLPSPEYLYQLVIAGLPADFSALRSINNRPHNLPAPLSSFIGRDEEKELVCGLLRRDSLRLLVLTGPGGSGKTRLALRAGEELLADFEDGVFFVPLAPIRDPALVPPSITLALGLKEIPGQPLLDGLKEHLRHKHLLILLDNFEQIKLAAPGVNELLRACPKLKVLVTSRESLHVSGEQEMSVPPLALPRRRPLPTVEMIAGSSAVQLFVERAQSVQETFSLGNDNAPAVAEICTRLDGLPLAIELAAARVKLLPLRTMLARLENLLQLSTGGPRDVEARQQTLYNTIRWSYDLLDESEKTLFQRFSVLGDGTLEAAAAICNPTGEVAADVAEGLASLVDKSLLRRSDDEEVGPRFNMLETIREFARDQLGQSEEVAPVQRAHATFFLHMAERMAKLNEALPSGTQQGLWLQTLEREHNNFRAALAWSLDDGAVVALRLSGALWRFWEMGVHVAEGRRWLESALERCRATGAISAQEVAWKAKALTGAGKLAWYDSDYPAARTHLRESLEISRAAATHDTQNVLDALNALGLIEMGQGDLVTARSLYVEALPIGRASENPRAVLESLYYLSSVAMCQGDWEECLAVSREGLTLARRWGDLRAVGLALQQSGIALFYRGDVEGARLPLEESLDSLRRLGDRWGAMRTQWMLGFVAREQGDYTQAYDLLVEILEVLKELGSKWEVTHALDAFGYLAAAQGEPERAARLIGAAESLREAIGHPLYPGQLVEHERHVSMARAASGEDAFEAARRQGRSLTLEQAMREALEKSLVLRFEEAGRFKG